MVVRSRARWKIAGTVLLALIFLAAIGLATWEPLTARTAVPPPLHRYDAVIARDCWGVPLRQGSVDLPLDGGPDVLRAAALWDEAPDGRLVVRDGDSFVMFITWNRHGQVTSRSFQPFGAATTRPASPHYADQAPLFATHRTKPVLFAPAALRGNVERIYRPQGYRF